MKTVMHHYNPKLNGIDVLANAMGGTIKGNFITGDNEMYKGTHFILPIEEDVTAMLIDTTYKEDVLLKYRVKDGDFIGLYYYFTNLDVDFILNDEPSLVGKLNYNLSIVDSTIDTDYIVQKDTAVFVICILIKKEALKNYFTKIDKLASVIDVIFDKEKNTIIRLDRMSIESFLLIKDFKKIPYSSSLYEVYFKGLVYALMGDYLKQLETMEIVISKTISIDVKNIIASKAMLISNIEGPFPGVTFLAEQVAMSPSKYKKLFTKISGVNPGKYFYNNKLNRAKELLETGKFTVNEVAQRLGYANVSYLAKRFNEMYGLLPKEYQSLF